MQSHNKQRIALDLLQSDFIDKIIFKRTIDVISSDVRFTTVPLNLYLG